MEPLNLSGIKPGLPNDPMPTEEDCICTACRENKLSSLLGNLEHWPTVSISDKLLKEAKGG